MDNSNCGNCPFWSLDGNRECAITEGGVYIPLSKHIMMFCQSSNYMHCSRYIKGRYLFIGKEVSERRKLRRYVKKIYMDIVVCDTKEDHPVKSKYRVKTLDMNLYGMKIESPTQVATDAIVGFELDSDFSSDFLPGTGKVKWCERQRNSDKFEFGMAFSDDPAIQKGIEKLLHL